MYCITCNWLVSYAEGPQRLILLLLTMCSPKKASILTESSVVKKQPRAMSKDRLSVIRVSHIMIRIMIQKRIKYEEKLASELARSVRPTRPLSTFSYMFISQCYNYLINVNKICRLFTVLCFLPARRYASAGNSDRNVSVRMSVRPSVTCRYSVKTKKASGMISSPSVSPKTLVF